MVISLFNPYIVYAFSFIFVLIIYQLGWSTIFPDLTFETLSFLIFTIIISFSIGIFVKSKNIISYSNVTNENKIFMRISKTFIVVGYAAEFIYHKELPLLSLILGQSSVTYMEFGIPVFHVLLVTYNSFLAIFVFHKFISQKNKFHFFEFLILLIPSLLIINRGMLVIILISCLTIFLLKTQQLKFKSILLLSLSIFLFLHLFGLMGNLRVNEAYQNDNNIQDSSLIMSIGSAEEEFIESPIPNTYFWSYLYIVSPLANFQQTVNDYENERIKFENLIYYINDELIYDFIGKRFEIFFNREEPSISKIAPELTVGTVYAKSYLYLGWLGPLLTYCFLITSSFCYLYLLKYLKSPFYITGVSILTTIFILNTFSNMISFSGLSLQLIFPILFSFLFYRKEE